MSLSEAVRIWNLDRNGVRLAPKVRMEYDRVRMMVDVLEIKDGHAKLKRGRKVTVVKNLKLLSKIKQGDDIFVTMPTFVASRLV